MNLNFKVKSKPVNPDYHLISPSQQRLGRKGFYGSLSLIFALTMGLGTTAHADNPYGRIEWEKRHYKINESAGKVYLVANRLEGSNGEVTVKYHTRSQTAKAGMNSDYDYQAASGELTWGPGDKTSRLVEITIFDDQKDEEDEFFQVVLVDAIGTPTTPELGKIAKVTIEDDDEPPPVIPSLHGQLNIFMGILKFRIFGLGVVRSSANFAEARGFDGGMEQFDEASQAFLMGLQNGLSQLNLPGLEVSVTEDGAVITVPIYNDQGELEGEYHVVAGEPVATSETETGIFTTASGLAYLIYSDEHGNYRRANLYATLAPEILRALAANFPEAEITQQGEVVTLKLDEYESYHFVANHFVKSGGFDSEPLVTQLIDADNDGVADYAVLSAAGKEQFVYSAD
jgi:hypothetical protein